MVTNLVKNLKYVSLLLPFLLTFAGHASSLEYYTNLFLESGVSVEPIVSGDDPYIEFENTKTATNFLLTLASGLNNINFVDLKKPLKLVVICNEEVTLGNYICGYEKILNNIKQVEYRQPDIQIYENQEVQFFLFPEILFTNPKNSEKYEALLKSLDSNTNTVYTTSRTKTLGIGILSTLALTLLFLGCVVAVLRVRIIGNDVTIKSVRKSVEDKVTKLQKQSDIILLGLVVGATFYLPIIYLAYVKGRGVNNSIDLAKGLFSKDNIDRLVSLVEGHNSFVVFSLLSSYVLLILLALFLIPIIYRYLSIKNDSLKKCGSNSNTFTKAFFISMIILLVLDASSIHHRLVQESKSLLVAFALLFFYLARHQGTLDTNLPTKTKIKFAISALTIVLILFPLSLAFKNRGTNSYSINLFDASKKFATLPIEVSLNENSSLTSTFISSKNSLWPVYVDQFMIFIPNKYEVQNLVYKGEEISPDASITAKDKHVLFEHLLSYPNLEKYFASKTTTTAFTVEINSEKTAAENTLTMVLDFDCTVEKPSQTKLDINLYYLNDNGTSMSFIRTRKPLLNFPGCDDEKLINRHFAYVDISSVLDKKMIMEITNAPDNLHAIKLIKDAKIINTNFLEVPYKAEVHPLIFKSESTNPEDIRKNYIIGLKDDISFDTELIYNTEWDIAKPVNELIENNLISQRFKIWSPKEYYVIKNEF